MNGILAVLFLIFFTILGMWLLFDDDSPPSESNDTLDQPTQKTQEPRRPWSKSA